MNKYFKYTKQVLAHKWVVFKLMCKFGRSLQGLTHDMSKFSIAEFKPYVMYFTGSPEEKELYREDFEKAWLHHQQHNPHHPEYWGERILLPEKYAVELICDWLAAGMIYDKETWNYNSPLEYFLANKDKKNLHPVMNIFIEKVFTRIANNQSLDCVNKSILNFYYNYSIEEYRYQEYLKSL